jgi:hypothetical protein
LAGVLNGNGRSGVVSDNMPPLHTVLNAKLFNLFCHAIEIAGAVRNEWRFSHARQVDRKASVMAGELLDDAAPQHAVGRHAVDEENGIAFTLVGTMHGVAPFSHRQIGAICRIG